MRQFMLLAALLVSTICSVEAFEARIDFTRSNGITPASFNRMDNPYNTGIIQLKDTSGVQSSFSFENLGGFPGAFLDGQSTGSNSGIYPDDVLKSFWTVRGPETVKFSGLNPSSLYNFDFLSSRSSNSGVRETLFRIGGVEVVLDARLNTDNLATISNVTPNANGEVLIEMDLAPGSQYGYVNAIAMRGDGAPAPDSISPEITMIGQAPLSIVENQPFTDPGATAMDNVDGDLTSQIQVAQNVDISTIGTYSVQYSVSDTAGNAANVARTVNVISANAPQYKQLAIDFTNSSSKTPSTWNSFHQNGGQTANALIATDGSSHPVSLKTLNGFDGKFADGTRTPDSTGVYPDDVMETFWTVREEESLELSNLNPLATYKLDFFASRDSTSSTRVTEYWVDGYPRVSLDAKKNTSNIVSLDNITPSSQGKIIIKMDRANGSTYGYINALVVHIPDDGSNSEADYLAPQITLTGDNPLDLEVGTLQYSDPGYTANDNVDGDLTSQVTLDSSQLDLNTIGSYQVSYSVQDSAGNTATENRTVNVIATTSSDGALPGQQIEVSYSSTYGNGQMLGYLEYIPQTYDANSSQGIPLLISLHGLGWRGDGQSIQFSKLRNGNHVAKLVEQGAHFPFILISPQQPKDLSGHYSGRSSWDASIIDEVLERVKGMRNVDHSRVYITGTSMGGGGVWSYLKSHGDKIAAAAPICGTGTLNNSSEACDGKVKNTPIWALHNVDDPTVGSSSTNSIVGLIRGCATPAPILPLMTMFAYGTHNAWDKTYDGSGRPLTNKTNDSSNNALYPMIGYGATFNPSYPGIFDWLLQYDSDAPNLVGAELDPSGLSVTLRFDRDVSVTDPSGIKVNGTSNLVSSVQAGPSAQELQVTLNSGLGAGNHIFTYDAQSGNITDLNGKNMQSVVKFPIENL